MTRCSLCKAFLSKSYVATHTCGLSKRQAGPLLLCPAGKGQNRCKLCKEMASKDHKCSHLHCELRPVRFVG